jgi:hypothetical protein
LFFSRLGYFILKKKTGQPSWGHGGPDNAGTYNSAPANTAFFSDNQNNNYASPYGKFFLNWYFNSLRNHSIAVLAAASSILTAYRSTTAVSGPRAHISGEEGGVSQLILFFACVLIMCFVVYFICSP